MPQIMETPTLARGDSRRLRPPATVDDPLVIPTRQRLLMLRAFGGPEEFAVAERQPVPEPAAGEVLVKVLAASVQYTDVIVRKGRYPDLKERPPLILGYDVIGEIVKLGEGVTRLAIGQRVADLTVTGSYSQYRTLKAEDLVPISAALDPAEAACLVLSWTTAYQLLHRDARVRKGQRLLVVGAAGAVGQALLVLGKLAGCEVWGAAHPRHAARVRELGASYVDSDRANFARILPTGFDAVFDGIGEDGFVRAWHAVGPRGHLSAFGFSAGIEREVSMARIGLWLARLWWWNTTSANRSASFFSITSQRQHHPESFFADLGALLGMLARHDIQPRVGERIGLDAVAAAHTRLEHGGLEGKIVLIPNQ